MVEVAKDQPVPAVLGATPEKTALTPAWRDYFLRLIQHPLRFSGPRNYLRRDVRSAMRRLIPKDASVLEAGVGNGQLLADLPNERRHGIDVLPEALEAARARDARITVEQADALDVPGSARWDAIVCDRLCHSVPDVQRLVANLATHLTANGRVFLTCFNFIWAFPLILGAKL